MVWGSLLAEAAAQPGTEQAWWGSRPTEGVRPEGAALCLSAFVPFWGLGRWGCTGLPMREMPILVRVASLGEMGTQWGHWWAHPHTVHSFPLGPARDCSWAGGTCCLPSLVRLRLRADPSRPDWA